MRSFTLLLCVLLAGCASTPFTAHGFLAGGKACGEPDREARLVQGMIRERLSGGRPHAALAELDRLDPAQPWVILLRGDVQRALNQPAAEATYQQLLNTCLWGDAEYGLGLLAAQNRHFAKAAVHLANAVRELPTRADIRNDQGFVLLNLGQDDAAAFALRTAAELSPEREEALWNLSLLSLVRGDAAGWADWSARLKPSPARRADLQRACLAVRQNRQSDTPAACPLLES